MSIIFQTKTCKIFKQSDTKYKLNFDNGEKFNHFFSFIKKKLNISNNSLIFNAIKVESLKDILKRKDTLSYRHLKELFNNIAKQFESLEKDNFCHLFININDIIRVELDSQTQIGGTGNDVIFLYLNTQDFLSIEDKKTKILKPFDKKHIFISPELKNINSFPIQIHINSQLYSLAILTCYCGEWNKNQKKYENIEQNIDFFKEYLSNISNTKLYWALLRCLEPNPQQRIYLYI